MERPLQNSKQGKVLSEAKDMDANPRTIPSGAIRLRSAGADLVILISNIFKHPRFSPILICLRSIVAIAAVTKFSSRYL